MIYSKKPLFNLNLIIKETGLKADTIRAWERRYQLPQPARSKGGQRLYSEFDLQTIHWLVDRQKEGMRISQAVAYWSELNDKGIDPLTNGLESNPPAIIPLKLGTNDNLEDLQDQWLKFCLEFDETNADQILSQAFAQYPVHTVCAELIMQGLREIGELWSKGEISVQQEHFTSEIAVRKLQALISSAPNPFHKQSILLGNPPGEHHTIGLLMMALLLKNRGWPIIYLGGNVPLRDLLITIKDSSIELTIMSASRLVTSAALLEATQLLAKNGTTVAFSGWIFSKSQGLNEQIPGLYLGIDLAKAVNKVEQFLNNPVPVSPVDHLVNSHEDLIKKIQEAELQLNKLVLDKMETKNLEFNPEDIIRANRDLTADITASLRFGSINHLSPNLEWASNLLANRNFSEAAFLIYLSIFAETFEEILGNDAQAIIPIIRDFS